MEARIYLEAELMYKKVNDIRPIEGDLRKWIGHIKTKDSNLTLTVNIELPENYPQIPPIIKIKPPILHPNVDRNGKINLDLLTYWKPNYYLYQIFNNLKAIFWRTTPTLLYNQEIKKAKIKKKTLKKPKKVKMKPPDFKKEMQISKEKMEKKIQVQFSLDNYSITLKDKILDLQSEKMSIINLVEKLDEHFEKGDLSPEIYSKLYKKYYNILVLINEELNKVGQLS